MKSKKKFGCIYRIFCVPTGRCYIGQTVNYDGRLYAHKNDLKYNKHCNKDLQMDYNKYGIYNFMFELIEDNVPNEELLERETYWMNIFGGIDSDTIYNMEDKYHYNIQAKQNISKGRKGMLSGCDNPMYGIHRFGTDNPMYGKTHSEYTKQLISQKSKTGNKYIKYTEELTNRIREDRKSGMKLRELSKKYDIAQSTLSTLINHGTTKFNKI